MSDLKVAAKAFVDLVDSGNYSQGAYGYALDDLRAATHDAPEDPPHSNFVIGVDGVARYDDPAVSGD